jgi:hypothetical protein
MPLTCTYGRQWLTANTSPRLWPTPQFWLENHARPDWARAVHVAKDAQLLKVMASRARGGWGRCCAADSPAFPRRPSGRARRFRLPRWRGLALATGRWPRQSTSGERAARRTSDAVAPRLPAPRRRSRPPTSYTTARDVTPASGPADSQPARVGPPRRPHMALSAHCGHVRKHCGSGPTQKIAPTGCNQRRCADLHSADGSGVLGSGHRRTVPPDHRPTHVPARPTSSSGSAARALQANGGVERAPRGGCVHCHPPSLRAAPPA